MPWSSKVKSLTHKIIKDLTGSEELADLAGHYTGGITALATADVSYPVIQTTKWIAKGIVEEITQESLSEERMESYGDAIENSWEDAEKAEKYLGSVIN